MTLPNNYFTNVPKPHQVSEPELDAMVNAINANQAAIENTSSGHDHDGSDSKKIVVPQSYTMRIGAVASTAHKLNFLNSFMTPVAAKISIYAQPAINLTADNVEATGTIAAHSLSVVEQALNTQTDGGHIHTIATGSGNHTHSIASHGHDFVWFNDAAAQLSLGIRWGEPFRLVSTSTGPTGENKLPEGAVYGGVANKALSAAANTLPEITVPSTSSTHSHAITAHTHSLSGSQTHSFVPVVHEHTVTKTLGSSLPTSVTIKIDATTIFSARDFDSLGDYLNQDISYTYFGAGNHFFEVTTNIDCDIEISLNLLGTITIP